MWFLTSDYDHQRVIYIMPDKSEVTIGRSPDKQICDFAIQDDPSISRKHATLMASSEGLYITDLDSRYGTFINSLKQDGKNKVKLSKGDLVKLGKINCIWKVNEMSFVTCTSTLKGENIQNVKQNLAKIGGLFKNDWDNTCEYLTMPAITLTIKVVLALVQGSYIVTTDYWNKCVESIKNNVRLPDPKKFTPDILESTLNKEIVSFLPNPNRANLFAGKKFVFFSKKQFDMYKNVVSKGSATPVLLEESHWSSLKLDDEKMVVIQSTTNQDDTEAQKKQVTAILAFLKSKGKRVVADAEIGLAILYCSITKYCNPAFNLPSEVVKQVPAQSSNKVLAQESQEPAVGKNKANIVINESLTADENSSKRKLSDIHDDEPSSNSKKKVAHDIPKANESAKRKHADEDNLIPAKKAAVEQDQDDFFNFITPATKDDAKSTDNKLNLAVPQKRKADFETDENLFNFVEGENNAKRTMFENNRTDAKSSKIKVEPNVTAQDIAAMRGSKLDELNKDNLNFIQPNSIKKELYDELGERMNQLDIGSIVVTIKKELIVKKEPLEIEAQDNYVKNFKKFKKVWPLKMQVTIIPKSSMTMHSITIDDGEPEPVLENPAMDINSA